MHTHAYLAQCCMHTVEQSYGRRHIHAVLTLLLFSRGCSQYLSHKVSTVLEAHYRVSRALTADFTKALFS